MSRYVSFHDFDWVLLGFVLAICGLGIMEIHSATMHTKFAGAQMRQIYWVLAGVGLMFLVSLINYQALLDKIHWFYIAAVASLMAVLVFGTKALGAKRWIRMPGGNHFQPSEWVKLILILAVAKYFAELRHRDLSWSDFMKAGAMVGVPMLLVLAQPDLGTALTYVPIAVMGVFLGGLQWKQGLAVALLAAVGIGAVFLVPRVHVLKSYQRQRLTSFLNPEADPQGSGYQVEQSMIAVGSGGLWGGKGSQTHGAFLPVSHTDFIFAAFAEEHGFVGALGVLLLYFIVLMRLTQNAQTAPDRAGTFLVMGVVAVLSFHILVNVGMVVGFMPVTGIPLPLMSYGGSSVLFMFLALGMVMNVRMRRFVN
ncbi:MAG: rod shape-determining protein RodA [Candidatus Sulfotelmatobacter sp.]|jgi:rod shape determining protein RodA|uniref:Peptidoglycan glycosyltransferase RodA n=1 Tax=Candidatus Sulfotelmatobacter kueseliae TaxID=2042962 RepID=A0A2U3KMU5_9BACT|nr:Cell elongation-specific peptidoglycan biosynthesis regulator RodA [Candidatus Sulfotelmatobacter kueseliae]